jgi:hypothetical protein
MVFLYSLTQSRGIHSFKSKLFLKIHPDLFLNSNLEVKDINMKCLKSVIQFLEKYASIEKSLISATNANQSRPNFVPSFLQPVYDLSCYIHKPALPEWDLHSVNTSLQRPEIKSGAHLLYIHFLLQIPSCLCPLRSRQPNVKELNQALYCVKFQFIEDYLKQLGIFAEVDPSPLDRSRENDSRSTPKNRKHLDELLFERIMSKSFSSFSS